MLGLFSNQLVSPFLPRSINQMSADVEYESNMEANDGLRRWLQRVQSIYPIQLHVVLLTSAHCSCVHCFGSVFDFAPVLYLVFVQEF